MAEIFPVDFAIVAKGTILYLTPECVSKGSLGYAPTGSRYICDPPPTDTDYDIIVLVKDQFKFSKLAKAEGFEGTVLPSGSEGYDTQYVQTYRKGDINLIVTANTEYYRRWRACTAAAKQMNLMQKKDRVKLFQTICDDFEQF